MGALGVLGYFILFLGWLLIELFPRIRAVEVVSSTEGEIGKVRTGLGRLAFIHHVGLAMVTGVLAREAVLILR